MQQDLFFKLSKVGESGYTSHTKIALAGKLPESGRHEWLHVVSEGRMPHVLLDVFEEW